MALSRESIIKHAGVFKTEEVHVPAWADETGDDVVLVRSMTLREYEVQQTRASANGSKDEGKVAAAMLVRLVLKPDGDRLFNDSDIDLIAELSIGDTDLLSTAIMHVSGLTDEAKAEQAKNSAAGQTGSSSSDSAPKSSTAAPTSLRTA